SLNVGAFLVNDLATLVLGLFEVEGFFDGSHGFFAGEGIGDDLTVAGWAGFRCLRGSRSGQHARSTGAYAQRGCAAHKASAANRALAELVHKCIDLQL